MRSVDVVRWLLESAGAVVLLVLLIARAVQDPCLGTIVLAALSPLIALAALFLLGNVLLGLQDLLIGAPPGWDQAPSYGSGILVMALGSLGGLAVLIFLVERVPCTGLMVIPSALSPLIAYAVAYGLLPAVLVVASLPLVMARRLWRRTG